jgi:hypothetical protein
MRNGVYNQGALSITFDGQVINDCGADFAYRVTGSDTIGSITKGTERGVGNFTTDKTCTLDISLMPTSAANDIFLEYYYAQVRGQGRLVDMTIISTEGEKLSFSKCLMTKNANIEGGGQQLVPREYTFGVIEFIPDTGEFPNQ